MDNETVFMGAPPSKLCRASHHTFVDNVHSPLGSGISQPPWHFWYLNPSVLPPGKHFGLSASVPEDVNAYCWVRTVPVIPPGVSATSFHCQGALPSSAGRSNSTVVCIFNSVSLCHWRLRLPPTSVETSV